MVTDDVEVEVRQKRYKVTFREKYDRFEQDQKDVVTPFTAHEIKVLRKQLGVPARRMALMIGCSKQYLEAIEGGHGQFTGPWRIKLHRIRRYTLLALDDMRDRFEMPDFSK